MAAAGLSDLSPFLTPLQQAAAKGPYPPVPRRCVVTGGSGFVGQRLVEMLVERGAEHVVSFDIVAPAKERVWACPKISHVVGDIADADAVSRACEGADCVFHVAAAVGPFHPPHVYRRVNYEGTLNVIAACKAHKVPKMVFATSPSTRFDGSDVDGLDESQLPAIPMPHYLQAYAETKALGEIAAIEACCDEFLTIAVAPHQVYGPRDNLFMPNLLEAGGSGMLRIPATARTGYGMNRVSLTHVDNYAHGLCLAAHALTKDSAVRGKFYIVTDGDTHPQAEGYVFLWRAIDDMVTAMGFPSIWDKFKVPTWLLLPVARLCDLYSAATGRHLKLSTFNVHLITMHRWFRIDAAVRDLGYHPIIPFAAGWKDTAEWYRANWLPNFRKGGSNVAGIAAGTQQRIAQQAHGSQ